ncbi:NAD(P)H-binding protein [Actinoplanes sp. CA-051413]|uniref:NAD(P)H-binding protein n=1 Tax=Actinoplanes sp. CA-051413 TaxID=3239899 RepID=UPI003D98F459
MILVTGATGTIGSAVVQALHDTGVPVRALVRDPTKAADRLPHGTALATGDLNDPGSVAPALPGIAGLFLLAGYDNAEQLLADARAAGVGHVVLLSSSSVLGTDTDNAVARYHLAAERAVAGSGIPWTFLRPNSFMTNTLQWKDQLDRGDTISTQFPDVAVSTIDPRDIADVAVRAFTEPGHQLRRYRLTGPQALTPADRVGVLAEVLGRPLRAVGQTREQTHDELYATLPTEYAAAFEAFFADGVIDETTVTTTVEEVIGHPGRTFARWVSDHRAAFS